jgi:hypothetical protein
MAYNVFICWAGPTSRQIAEVVHEWLPTVIQAAEPFMSERDIDAGDRGLHEIASQLREIQIGLICVTADNQGAPWLNFETGALSKIVENARVIPVAFDINKGQIRLPLGQFQAKYLSKEDMMHVLRTINRALGQQLNEQRLATVFQRGWPELHTKIEHIRSAAAQQPLIEEQKRSAEDMLEELIVTMRHQTDILKNIRPRSTLSSVMNTQIAACEAALYRLGDIYGMNSSMTTQQLVEMAPKFDLVDWQVLETSPFLLWYIEKYFNIHRPSDEELSARRDWNEVPF